VDSVAPQPKKLKETTLHVDPEQREDGCRKRQHCITLSIIRNREMNEDKFKKAAYNETSAILLLLLPQNYKTEQMPKMCSSGYFTEPTRWYWSGNGS
jgi:hypothetical protein